MSDTEKPQPQQPDEVQSGAEAPTLPEQPAVAAEAQQEAPPASGEQPVPPPPVQRRWRRPPNQVRTWVAAVIGAVLLLGGGIGGYFIGAANDHNGNRPGLTRFGDHRPGDFRGGPPFRYERPNR